MREPWTPSDELQTLTAAACCGELTDKDVGRLEMILSDPRACRWYRDLWLLQAELRILATGDRADATAQECVRREATSLALPLVETSACPQPLPVSAVPYTTFSSLGNAAQNAAGFVSHGWPLAYLAATVICGLGVLIGALVHVSTPVQVARQSVPLPSPLSTLRSAVGRITGMVDCKWVQSPDTSGQWSVVSGQKGSESKSTGHQPLAISHLVALGDKFALSSGLMEITYNSGAKVILQGPVAYEVESAAGGFLSLGKLTARVDKKGNDECRMINDESQMPTSGIHHSSFSTQHLFSVRTPTAVVTDLGTEFGVEVDKQGITMSHVFRGRIEVHVLAGDGKPDGTRQVLREDQAMRIDPVGDARKMVVFPAAKSPDFVRAIPRRPVKLFDLVDVVAGGDGFSGRRGRGIDPTSGRLTDTPFEERKDASPNVGYHARVNIVGDERYHRVEAMPLVDGVFIPNGRPGAVQVDSAGHTFADFGPTDGVTDGMAMQSIWAGGAILVPSSSMPSWVASLLPSAPPSRTLVRTQLDGVDYAAPGRGLIFLHANSGITFDLEAIRCANPNSKLLRFRATAGNTEPMSETGKEVVYADVWVLVDGHVRFRRREINGCSGAFPISFPVAEKDRFLTLAASDSGNGRGGDWILFGDPVLEMAPAVSPGQTTQQPK